MKPEAGTISPGSTNKTTNDQAPPLSSDQLVADERLGLYIALFIVGTIGNTALITVVMRRKTQKSVYEMFVLNLGVSDLLLLLLHIVPNVHVMVTDFEASSLYCNFIWPMNTVVFLLEIFTVTSMALHRYWLIVHPYTPKPTRRATGMWIAGDLSVVIQSLLFPLRGGGGGRGYFHIVWVGVCRWVRESPTLY